MGEVAKRAARLRELIDEANYRYHVLDDPQVTVAEDRGERPRRLRERERQPAVFGFGPVLRKFDDLLQQFGQVYRRALERAHLQFRELAQVGGEAAHALHLRLHAGHGLALRPTIRGVGDVRQHGPDGGERVLSS